jgi:hypothetical protein
VVNLSRDHKPVVVCVGPTKQFRTILTSDDLLDLLAQGDSDGVQRIASELHFEFRVAAQLDDARARTVRAIASMAAPLQGSRATGLAPRTVGETRRP